MLGKLKRLIGVLSRIGSFPDVADSPERYQLLRRNMFILMFATAALPLVVMGVINYHQYVKSLRNEVVQGLRVQAYRMKTSVDYFMTDHLSALEFVSGSNSSANLSDEKTLRKVFHLLKKEFPGFIDLGLIDPAGLQVNYVGPYDLKGKRYAGQSWFQEVQVRGTYVSEVFLGYRKFPHFVIAVQHREESDDVWILRATIDTDAFYNLLISQGVSPETDVFVVNKSGTLQTPSKYYGRAMDTWGLPLPPTSYEPVVQEAVNPDGRKIFMAYCYLPQVPFVVVAIKPHEVLLRSLYTPKSELFAILVSSLVAIFLVTFKIADRLVRRIQECDQKREAAYQQVQHASRLASIGRLAAGVAHEINNPLAIINEKAGLMKDIIEYSPDFREKEKFNALTVSILQSVDRCKNITHRLLGFARRMDVQIDMLDVNEIIEDVLSFVEKEALFRKVDIELHLSPDLPRIASDRGQLQQVFLNIINNGLDAMENGGKLIIQSQEHDVDKVSISIQDNGCGLSEETLKHIFEPFFTTKKGTGTGLGLSITYGIVKKLGGEIKVQSKEGTGTVFTVILPKKTSPGGEFQNA